MTVLSKIEPAVVALTAVNSVGDGYNVFTGEALPTCLAPVDTNPGSTGIEANAFVCTSTSELYESLGIDADVAVGTPWGSFKDKLNFVNELNITTTSVVILVRAARVQSSQTINGLPTFADAPDSADALFAQGGNAYVSSISLGGEFIAAFAFTARDESHFTELQNAASAEFGSGAWSFDGTFDVKMETISVTTQSTFTFSQKGIGFSTTDLPTPDQFITFVLTFDSVPLDGPDVVDFSTNSYSTVAGCPDGFAQIDAYAAAYNGDGGYADLMALSLQRQSLVQAVIAQYNHYYAADPQLVTVLARLGDDIAQAKAWVAQVLAAPSSPDIPVPTFNGVQAGSPIARYALLTTDGYGGSGGVPFTDVNLDTIALGYRFSTFAIKGEDLVDGLAVTYVPTNPEDPDAFVYHGGDGGAFSQSYQLGDGEYVTSIQATALGYVSQLQITTNLNDFPGWPGNPSGGQTWTTPSNAMFVGFSGRAGQYLDNIAPVYVAFKPAAWIGGADDVLARPVKPNRAAAARMRWSRPLAASPDIDLIAPIADWGRMQWPTIQQVYHQQGDWQGWAQVEIASLLQSRFPAMTVNRESGVYLDASQACSLSLCPPAGPAATNHVIELRCEAQSPAGGAAQAFCKGLADDIQKVSQGALTPAWRPARLWALGLTCSQAAADLAAGYPFGVDLQSMKLGTSAAGDLILWWRVAQQP